MKVEGVELREIRLDLRAPFSTSFGTVHQRRILLVRATGDGVEGWGECVAEHAPEYSGETVDTAWSILRDFAVPLATRDPIEAPAEVAERLKAIRGNPMAKAALEGAVWDAWARQRDTPLWKAIGGSARPVPVGVSIGLQPTTRALLELVEGYLAEGYLRLKLKIAPARDLEPLHALRRLFPDVPLAADANGAYVLDQSDQLAALDVLNLMFLEQPLAHDDLHDHARLAAGLTTPVCLDESIRHARDARIALEMGAAEIVNVKTGRVGGLTEAVAVHEICHRTGAPAWVGGMLESGIGRAFNVALATLPGFTLPGDVSASSRYWHRDIVDPPWQLQDGHLTPRAEPGIGVAIDREYLDSVTVRTEVVL